MKLGKLIGGSGAIAFALVLGLSPLTSSAQELYNFDKFMKMADVNKDGMVTKEEFMTAMSTAFDNKMMAMKAMPNSASMMKGDAMTRAGLKSLIDDLYLGP